MTFKNIELTFDSNFPRGPYSSVCVDFEITVNHEP
jgi:hypothetical protein